MNARHLLRRMAVAMLAALALLAGGALSPSTAGAQSYVYYWPSSSIPYAIGNMTFFSGSTSYPAVQSGPAQWTGVSGSALGFWYAGADNSVSFTGYPCNGRGNVWFYQYNLTTYVGAGTIGYTDICPGSNTEQGVQIAGVSVLFNTDSTSWHINYPSTPADTWRFDLAGLATHEMGHATGLIGHFSGSTNCPGTSAGNNTMCTGGSFGAAANSAWARSLYTQDIAVYAARY